MQTGVLPSRPLAALVLSLSLAACASKPPPPEPMTCTVTASANINPTEQNRPSPLRLRIYGLKSAAAFKAAEFTALYQHDQAELGGDITTKDEFVISPGETRSCSKILSADTQFIGVVGGFRDVGATSRKSAPIEGGKKANVLIRIDAIAIDVVVTR